jgi:3-keto-disaccharide hydrolase
MMRVARAEFKPKRDTLGPVRTVITLLALVAVQAASPADWRSAPPSDWQTIFNGRNLDGWVVKLAHHDLGDNYAETFRVENGVIRVMYDKYGDFGARFGHLFYKRELSHYVLALEYRFVGEQAKGGPGYARLNSGVMVHSQAPETILKDQDWPISVEAQFLAGGRTTMNVCTPGTEIFMKGEMVRAHCTNSASRIYANDEWVSVEVEVLGSERVRHIIDRQTVLQYERPTIGGGVANGFDPAIKKDGTLLERGYIGLQAESQPVEFRNVRLLNLSGCMNPASAAYRAYFVHRDDTRCSSR